MSESHILACWILALVDKPFPLGIRARQGTGLHGSHCYFQSELQFQLVSNPARLSQWILDLDCQLVHLSFPRGNQPVFFDLRKASQDFLHATGKDIDSADDQHVIGSPDDPSLKKYELIRGPLVPAGSHTIARLVADQRTSTSAKRRQHEVTQLPLHCFLAGFHADELGNKLTLHDMQTLPLRARITPGTDFRGSRMVNDSCPPGCLDPVTNGRQAATMFTSYHDPANAACRKIQPLLPGNLCQPQGIGGRAKNTSPAAMMANIVNRLNDAL